MQRTHGAAEDAMQRSRAGCCDGPASAWHVAGEGEHTCYTAPLRKCSHVSGWRVAISKCSVRAGLRVLCIEQVSSGEET